MTACYSTYVVPMIFNTNRRSCYLYSESRPAWSVAFPTTFDGILSLIFLFMFMLVNYTMCQKPLPSRVCLGRLGLPLYAGCCDATTPSPNSLDPRFQVRRRRKEKERLLVMLQPRTTHTGRPLLLIDDLRLRWDQVPSPKSLGPRMISKYRTVCPCGNYYSPLEPDSLHF